MFGCTFITICCFLAGQPPHPLTTPNHPTRPPPSMEPAFVKGVASFSPLLSPQTHSGNMVPPQGRGPRRVSLCSPLPPQGAVHYLVIMGLFSFTIKSTVTIIIFSTHVQNANFAGTLTLVVLNCYSKTFTLLSQITIPDEMVDDLGCFTIMYLYMSCPSSPFASLLLPYPLLLLCPSQHTRICIQSQKQWFCLTMRDRRMMS